ncbi:MAG: excinuclease ABC subunit UvrC, partial [Xanthomonadales bacterium]|nr:excinuclease ABC subunit UvrC [Xanthomonadales bacterium]
LDHKAAVLYVGKAANLRKRVESYFARTPSDPRIATMVAQVAAMEFIVTRTEGEALLLEAQLIKSLKPRYNIDLRDDKSYPYIHFTDHEFPQVGFYRGSRQRPGRFFGPYPSAQAVRLTLNHVYRFFRLRQCEDSVYRHRSRPCLQHQIGRCSAPCVGMIESHNYARQLHHAELFLQGRADRLLDELGEEMQQAARDLAFERAAELRDQLASLQRVLANQYVQGERGELDVVVVHVADGQVCVELLYFRGGLSLGNRSYFPRSAGSLDPAEILRGFLLQHYLQLPPPGELLLSHPIEDQQALAELLSVTHGQRVKLIANPRGDRARWVEMGLRTAAAALEARAADAASMQRRFDDLAQLLDVDTIERVECFDISHTQGEQTVASCVVFGPEGALRNDYRRYNISGITPGDDYAAMRQALQRRFRRLRDGEGTAPDLLLIDGGRGQLAQAIEVLTELGLQDLALLGVAKGEERRAGEESLWRPGVDQPLRPPGNRPAALLIQQVRDEAHRFAITGHRARRGKQQTHSVLEDIAGVGGKRRKALLQHFGGLKGLERAGIEELMRVEGISRALAERIYERLHH